MASVSSSSINGSSYDVFLSFRGEDTRHSFTDHLYDALNRAGICTFRDNEDINRGVELKPEIERAIKESGASIVVLSENYATSTWCLDELFLILEQRRECNHFVLPVFYHVNPTDVRKQNKTFAMEVKASSRWTDHNVNKWKKALMEVADLAGMVLSGSETNFLKEIVDTVYNKLDCKEIHLPSNITGMATRYEEISWWLNQPNLNILAICGMGGSGKTTLAKYIYDLNWRTFETTSFVEDIDSKCKGPNGLLELQEQLLKDILGGKNRKIPCISRGTRKIEEALQTKRTLIVLDDIAQRSQLIALLGTGKIYSRSKIIITTRENTDNWFDLMCHKYEMKLLNDDESLELLSRHAFRSKIPMAGFEELVLQAIRYCEGNPLALEVLGSSLFKNNTISNWKSQLNLLEKDIDSRIQGVLIRSYMSLPYNSEKELFLHIACFFAGKDIDYVVKILEPDYSAKSGIKTLINGCLLSISPNKKLKMHRLIQEMGKNIVRQESIKVPARRSRVWLSIDSYKILSKGEGSETIEGLALDMQILSEEKYALKSPGLNTDALKKMDNLKLLQLDFAKLDGSYENFSEDLRWLCWLGFHLRTIPSELYMGNLVAIDMSYSNLEVFEPPMVLQSLQILNLKDSHNLLEIRNISRIPHLETLIIWNCYNLVRVCETIGDLTSLVLLNMTGCKNLCKMDHLNLLVASTSHGFTIPPFSFPRSLQWLFLKDCHLECTDSVPLSFSVQPFLQYLNLGNGLFEFLPFYDHLRNLRVLDLSLCSRLRCLLCLPSTLAELYIYYCESLEEITFQSHQFNLQEFGYEGCINLTEIEGFIKLVPIVKLDETDLGHLKWLKEYQNHEVCLVGDDELTVGRNWHVQMLYEFDIMSTSLPDIKDPNMTSEYVSASPLLSFEVPLCPTNKTLKGLDVTFKYTTQLLCSLSGNGCAWFCKISTTNGVDFMYNPKVFGKPEVGEVGIWLGYWPIGKMLEVGEKVDVFIATLSGLEVHECGVSLVYTDDEVGEEIMENNMGFNGDLSGFQLSTGAFYLCRHDFYELMEVGRLNPHWFSILVGDAIDYTEVRGWRKTGRPKQMNPSFIELKTIKCITDGPELEDIYKIAEISKSSLGDKTVAFTSSLLEKEMESVTRSESIDAEMEEVYKKQYVSDDEIYDLVMEKSDNNQHPPTMMRLNLRSMEAMESGPYPVREGEPDCSYYIRTGLCRFGATCRFNHPPNRKLAIATAKMRGEYPERVGQPECQYYLKTGTCKFGAICKFHHPRDMAGVAGRVSLNALGFPLRPNEPICANYLRTGQCKFGITCQFHHPQPSSGRVSLNALGFPLRPNEPKCVYYLRTGQCKFGITCQFDHPQPSNRMATFSGSPVYPTVQPPTSPDQQSYLGGMTNWSLSTASFVPSPRWQGPSNYAQMIRPQRMASVPGWNTDRGSLGSISSLESQQQAIGNNNLIYGNVHQNETATEQPSGTYSSFHALQRENVFPERPGQPDCQFYMKTGDCKFGAVCRFHHPRERVIPTRDYLLSPIGLPLRPFSYTMIKTQSLSPSLMKSSSPTSPTIGLFIKEGKGHV